ncbi:MAG: AEC family transporter [Oscillospiraceae bacterium]|nr:AEC family transporter [Oscillospiraceae bacterium]
MENLMLSANAVLPMFMLLAAGFLSQKAGVLTREDVPRFNKVAFRIFLPCLLFYNIYCSDLSAAVKPGLIIYAVCGVLLVFAAAYLSVQHLVRREDWKGVIAQGIFRSNFVIMGIPIAQALVGADQLGAVTVLIAVVVPLFNFLSVYVLERFRGGNVNVRKVLLEVAKNPLIISSLLGILCQLLGIRLPGLLEQTVSSLSVIASPLQLFLLGAFFRFDGLGRYLKPLTAVTTVKLFVTPALLLGTAALLGIRGGDFVGLIGIFASPTAVNSFTMVQQMDCGDAELAGDIVVMTSAVSIVSFFLWILIFKNFGIF